MLLDFRTPISRVVSVGRIEGVSTLVLFFIAMPLKYGFDMPKAVTYVGSIHGGLFVLLALVTFLAWINKHLSFGQSAMVAIAAVFPFGPFIVERWLPSDHPPLDEFRQTSSEPTAPDAEGADEGES